MRYEIFYLIGSSREADLETIKSEIKELIATEGAVFEEKETVEKRKLAYAVKHESRGIYVAQRFSLEDEQKEKIHEINRKLGHYGNILRYLISRADELPELKTKEERIAAESASKMKRPIKKEEEKKKPQPEISPEKKEIKKKVETEDIDKKLEELLNI